MRNGEQYDTTGTVDMVDTVRWTHTHTVNRESVDQVNVVLASTHTQREKIWINRKHINTVGLDTNTNHF